MGEVKTFYCLRCQARFPMEHDTAVIVERTCPECGSNSVRIETKLAKEAFAARAGAARPSD